MKTCMFLCCHVNFKHETQKHACFHENFPSSTYFYPHYIIMVKGVLQLLTSEGGVFGNRFPLLVNHPLRVTMVSRDQQHAATLLTGCLDLSDSLVCEDVTMEDK